MSMSMVETRTLDTVAILQIACEIGDMINASREVHEYLRWKHEIEQDERIQRLIEQFDKAKQKFKECERFGHYHPDYHRALEETRRFERQLEQFEAVRKFKQAEDALDDLLYTVSLTIARAVSDDIKVPSNDPLPTVGCGSGGRCSGNCGC